MNIYAVDFRAEVAGLRIGQSLPIPGGYVKRKERGSYCLKDENNPYRMRWGTLAEIQEDLTFFLENKTLPRAKTPAW